MISFPHERKMSAGAGKYTVIFLGESFLMFRKVALPGKMVQESGAGLSFKREKPNRIIDITIERSERVNTPFE